ncbi:hypothetical protein D3C73_1658220 [compost metagenome]
MGGIQQLLRRLRALHAVDQPARARLVALAELAVDGVQLVEAGAVVGDGRVHGQR